MKTIIWIFILSGTFLLSGCFKDSGNYDYTGKFEITVSGIEEEYNKVTMVDSLVFTPVISPAGRDYSYFWGIYNAYVQGYIPTMDTLSRSKDLSLPVVLSAGTYTLVFGVKDTKNGYTHYSQIKINVETSLTTGWYLLKDENGNTDIDVFTENNKIENVIAASNNGRQLRGKAKAMMYIPYDYVNWNAQLNDYKQETVMIALSEEDAAVIRVEDGKITRNFEDMFYFPPQNKKPSDVFMGNNAIYMVNDNRIHSIDKSGENTGRFGEPIISNYCFSPHRIATDFSTPILWDELSCSFKSVNSYDANLIAFTDNPEKGLPPMNNLNANILFIGAQKSGSLKGYCLLKHKTTGKYELRLIDAGSLRKYENITLKTTILDDQLSIIKASRWATHFDLNIIYFEKDNRIYSCNPDAGFFETPQLPPFPPGEEITFMQHLKFSSKNFSFSYLAVATCMENQYKLYLYPLDGQNLLENPQVLKGNGRVTKAIYIRNGSYSDPLM